MVCLGFGKLHHGAGMQMTKDGTGLYYKQMWPLIENSQIAGDIGLHFDNTQRQIYMFVFDNHYQSIILDISVGYQHELFSDKLAGAFRPILMVQTGGLSEKHSFTNDNITGIWMIKYILGLGIQFYNGMVLNEISLKFIQSEAMKGHAAFQLAFYWK